MTGEFPAHDRYGLPHPPLSTFGPCIPEWVTDAQIAFGEPETRADRQCAREFMDNQREANQRAATARERECQATGLGLQNLYVHPGRHIPVVGPPPRRIAVLAMLYGGPWHGEIRLVLIQESERLPEFQVGLRGHYALDLDNVPAHKYSANYRWEPAAQLSRYETCIAATASAMYYPQTTAINPYPLGPTTRTTWLTTSGTTVA